MLQFLSPAGLWTLAALALPVAIHLWRPPPRTVRLGSLRFLDNLPHRRLRNLRWRERGLLAARLALLAALSLLVAGPLWQRKPSTEPQRWALLDPTAAPAGASARRLAQLRAGGYALHRLAPGLPATNQSNRADATDQPAPPPDLWSLLREADAALPPGSTVAVFTPGRLAALHGARPALRNCRVEWVATPDAAGAATSRWIESARRVADGKDAAARVVVGSSDAAFTAWKEVPSPAPPGARTDPAMERSSDGARARLAGPPPGPWIAVSPAPAKTRVLILHGADRAEDARNVAAAVRAVALVAQEPLDITVRLIDARTAQAPPATDWLFWLAAQPVPEALAATVPNVVTDAWGDQRDLPATEPGWIVAPPGVPGAAALAAGPVRLWRRTLASPEVPPGETLWTDDHGAPLLTHVWTVHGQRWAFASRFLADWNDLPRNGALAAWARDLLLPPSTPLPADPAHDRRLADPSQYLPSVTAPAAGRPPAPPAPLVAPDATDLHWPLWLLAALLFLFERLLARRPARGSIIPASTPTNAAPTAPATIAR